MGYNGIVTIQPYDIWMSENGAVFILVKII